jgi:hypothetical protein
MVLLSNAPLFIDNVFHIFSTFRASVSVADCLLVRRAGISIIELRRQLSDKTDEISSLCSANKCKPSLKTKGNLSFAQGSGSHVSFDVRCPTIPAYNASLGQVH